MQEIGDFPRYREIFITSECRDCSVTQEHQYDLLDKSCWTNAAWSFGFQRQTDIQRAFEATFYEASLLDLEKWHEFEQKNPFIFKGCTSSTVKSSPSISENQF